MGEVMRVRPAAELTDDGSGSAFRDDATTGFRPTDVEVCPWASRFVEARAEAAFLSARLDTLRDSLWGCSLSVLLVCIVVATTFYKQAASGADLTATQQAEFIASSLGTVLSGVVVMVCMNSTMPSFLGRSTGEIIAVAYFTLLALLAVGVDAWHIWGLFLDDFEGFRSETQPLTISCWRANAFTVLILLAASFAVPLRFYASLSVATVSVTLCTCSALTRPSLSCPEVFPLVFVIVTAVLILKGKRDIERFDRISATRGTKSPRSPALGNPASPQASIIGAGLGDMDFEPVVPLPGSLESSPAAHARPPCSCVESEGDSETEGAAGSERSASSGRHCHESNPQTPAKQEPSEVKTPTAPMPPAPLMPFQQTAKAMCALGAQAPSTSEQTQTAPPAASGADVQKGRCPQRVVMPEPIQVQTPGAPTAPTPSITLHATTKSTREMETQTPPMSQQAPKNQRTPSLSSVDMDKTLRPHASSANQHPAPSSSTQVSKPAATGSSSSAASGQTAAPPPHVSKLRQLGWSPALDPQRSGGGPPAPDFQEPSIELSNDGPWFPLQVAEWLHELRIFGNVCVDGSGTECRIRIVDGDPIYCEGVLFLSGELLVYRRASGAMIAYACVAQPTPRECHIVNPKRIDLGLNGIWQPIGMPAWTRVLFIQGDHVIDGTGKVFVTSPTTDYPELTCFRQGHLLRVDDYLVYLSDCDVVMTFSRRAPV